MNGPQAFGRTNVTREAEWNIFTPIFRFGTWWGHHCICPTTRHVSWPWVHFWLFFKANWSFFERHSGTFLLRFSDSELGGVTIAYICLTIRHVSWPWVHFWLFLKANWAFFRETPIFRFYFPTTLTWPPRSRRENVANMPIARVLALNQSPINTIPLITRYSVNPKFVLSRDPLVVNLNIYIQIPHLINAEVNVISLFYKKVNGIVFESG